MDNLKLEFESKSCEIFIGEKILKSVGKFISENKFTPKCLIITNKNVFENHGKVLVEGLNELNISNYVAMIPDGEMFKNLQEAAKLYTRAIESELDRRSLIITLGGGVIGDLGGFVAATFLRGIPFIQIPTTLLAQVDASIGGKTAINHTLGKNLIGSFHQPRAVFIDLNILKTLHIREIKSGLGEIIKYGIISDEELFSYLENNSENILNGNLKSLKHIIKRSCEIKFGIVNIDEKELGLRRILNFGHTIAHAIEKETCYKKYRHGEAVAIGIRGAAYISLNLRKTSKANVIRLENLLKKFGFDITCAECDPDKLYQTLFQDKKVLEGVINWILMNDFGKVEISNDVSDKVVREVLRMLCNEG